MKLLITLCFFLGQQSFANDLSPMSLSEAQSLVDNPPANIQLVLQSTPRVYEFKNELGDSSVAFTGQTFRQVLLSDFKDSLGSYERGEFQGDDARALRSMMSFYDYDPQGLAHSSKAINGDTPFFLKAKNTNGEELGVYEGDLYGDLHKGTSLKAKIAGLDNPLRHKELLGWNTLSYGTKSFDSNGDGILTPDELVQTFLQVAAENAGSPQKSFQVPNGSLDSQKIRRAVILENGLDLSQFLQKFLHGAVSFSQATGDYLSIDLPQPGKGLAASNEDVVSGKPYTQLQHHWDEAFGYWGAARNYLDLTDLEIRKGYSMDGFVEKEYVGVLGEGDDEISLEREKSFGLSINAAKRDLGASDPNNKTDFSQETMEAFLKGRHLLQEKPQEYLKYAQAHSIIAIAQWEKTIAATVIHYINKTTNDVLAYGTAEFSFADLAKHYSEMKGFALAFQFNPNSLLSYDEFIKFHELVGDGPVFLQDGDKAQFVSNLKEARVILKKAFSFSETNVAGW